MVTNTSVTSTGKIWNGAIAWLLIVVFAFSCKPADPIIHVGLIIGGSPEEEEQAWLQFTEKETQWETERITWNSIATGDQALDDFDLLWFHQTKIPDQPDAISASDAIRDYVAAGGNLILDMEALHLLHHWGFEPNSLQTRIDTITDEGFGRPLGFHAFKDHPLFDGLHGGAYPWKAKEDHVVRQTGFFDDQLPANPEANVVAIQWTYITFHEENKLVFDYRVGDGAILGVGAYTYFAPDNFNRDELFHLYQNAGDWLTGHREGPAYYWDYNEREVVRDDLLTHPGSAMNPAGIWSVPQLSISESVDSATDAFVNLAGRRMLLMGRERGGIEEIWTHPFMAVRDVRAGIVQEGALMWLSELPAKITISPEMLIREYKAGQSIVKEIMTVSFDRPLAVVHYEFSGDPQIESLVLEATFNSRYMWPYDADASRDIHFDYDSSKNSLAIVAQEGRLATLLTSSSSPNRYTIGQFAGFRYEGSRPVGEPTDLVQVGASLVFEVDRASPAIDIVIGGSSEGLIDLLQHYEEEQENIPQLYRKTHENYRNFFAEKLTITGPDSVFNKGYKWALARTDQFFQTTPGIGTTHMAGFGTTARGWDGRHAISGRPGYAWYFGRDGEWSGMAVNAYGDFEWVREMLAVFQKYQHLNGKIFHELTTSGAVHYDASDATPLYVVLAAKYLQYSNDLAFVRTLWPSLERAINYCYQTDTDDDGLIENTNVGHGWIEGGPLFGAHTEFYLAGTWAACLESGGYIAGLLGYEALARQYLEDAEELKTIIDREFWDAEDEYYYNGKLKDGSYQETPAVLQAVPVYLQAVTDTTRVRRAIKPFSENAMTTDWGIRMIRSDDPRFHPGSYHGGMVWPLYGGWAALAEYEAGFYSSGFNHFYSNLMNYRYWGKGSVEETLHGSVFRPAGVCSQQCWSETMVLLPAVEGMLGLKPDAPNRRVTLSPRFPAHWSTAKVENIRIGNTTLSMEWQKEIGNTGIVLTRTDDSRESIVVTLNPIMPLGTIVDQVIIDDESADWRRITKPEGFELMLPAIDIGPGVEKVIAIHHEGGIGVLPQPVFPDPGGTSRGVRVLDQWLENEIFKFRFEGLQGVTYRTRIWSERPLEVLENGVLTGTEQPFYTVEFTCPPAPTIFSEGFVAIGLIGINQ